MKDADSLDLLAVEVFTWTAHLATTVDICLRQAELGQRVGFVFLDVANPDELPPRTMVGPGVWPYLRQSRLAAVEQMTRILRARGVTIFHAPLLAPRARPSCERLGIDSIDSLREFRPDGAALGMGVLSSLSRRFGDPHPDVKRHRRLVEFLLGSAWATFDSTQELIRRLKPTTVLVYNGRFACSKAIAEAARLSGTQLLYHELGATYDRYYLSNRPVHSAENSRDLLQSGWARAGEGREAIAARFFTPGRGGAPSLWTEFGDGQVRGTSIPQAGRRRIVYFVSSDDEHAAVEDGVRHVLFESQRRAVEWLMAWARARPDTELVIRVHPRLRNASSRERGWWTSLAGGNVIVVPPDSPVDSYALAAGADRVVCYRSSMGPESTYLGKVAILLGDAVYRGLDCTFEPETTSELEQLLSEPGLPPKPRVNCLPFGYAQLTRGTPYRFYEPLSATEGSFFGEPMLSPGSAPRSVADRLGSKIWFAVDKAARAAVNLRARLRPP